METKDERIQDKFNKKDLKNMKITVSVLKQGRTDFEKVFFKMIGTKASNEMIKGTESMLHGFNAIIFHYEKLIEVLEE